MTLLFVALCPQWDRGHRRGNVGDGRDENGSRDGRVCLCMRVYGALLHFSSDE